MAKKHKQSGNICTKHVGRVKNLKYKDVANNKEINAYLKREIQTWDSLDLQIIHRHIVFR